MAAEPPNLPANLLPPSGQTLGSIEHDAQHSLCPDQLWSFVPVVSPHPSALSSLLHPEVAVPFSSELGAPEDRGAGVSAPPCEGRLLGGKAGTAALLAQDCTLSGLVGPHTDPPTFPQTS